MIKLFHDRCGMIAGLMLSLFFLFINVPAFGGGERSEEIRLENINPTWQDDIVVITYNLIAPSAKKYEVNLIMRRESDSTFKFFPKTVSGDIGKGKFAGPGREIRWAYKQDAPKGFQGDDYYFVIDVKQAGGGKTWLYSTLGAAVIGGIVYILIPPSPQKELPSPPLRP